MKSGEEEGERGKEEGEGRRGEIGMEKAKDRKARPRSSSRKHNTDLSFVRCDK